MGNDSKLILIANDLSECQVTIDYINANPNTQLVSAISNTFIWQVKQGALSPEESLTPSVTPHVPSIAPQMPSATPHVPTNITPQVFEGQESLIGIYSAKLDALGMRFNLSGRRYILDALVLLNTENDKKNLFEKIASKYGKSEESIRAAMIRAVSLTWETTPQDVLQANYTAKLAPNKKAPTLMEFLYYYVQNY